MAKGDDGGEGRWSGSGGGEGEQEERTDGWMTTYADMVTLLMTFFVLMFAISNVDQQKAMLFFAGLSSDGLSAAQFEQIVDSFNPGYDPDDIWFPPPDDAFDPIEPQDPDEGDEWANEELDSLFTLMGDYIEDADLGDQIQLVYDGEFLLMTLRNDILFESGRAVVLPEMRYLAEVIGRVLAGTHNPENPFEIVVTGHTDNVPIHTVEFPSNWHVSVRRAVNFAEILIEASGIDPYYFQARGASEFRPIDTNDTPEGRQRNRRVVVQVTTPRASDRPDSEFR